MWTRFGMLMRRPWVRSSIRMRYAPSGTSAPSSLRPSHGNDTFPGGCSSPAASVRTCRRPRVRIVTVTASLRRSRNSIRTWSLGHAHTGEKILWRMWTSPTGTVSSLRRSLTAKEAAVAASSARTRIVGARRAKGRDSTRPAAYEAALAGTRRRVFDAFALERVDVGEVELRVRHGGSGPPLVLIHGHPRTHATWHRVAPLLARSHTVVCPDLRGYGESSKPPTTADHEH